MKQSRLLTILLTLSLPLLHAQETTEEEPTQPKTTPDTVNESEQSAVPEKELVPPQKPPVQVGKGAADGASTSRHSNLGNITIAVCAVAVAATAIILVSRHQGKRKK